MYATSVSKLTDIERNDKICNIKKIWGSNILKKSYGPKSHMNNNRETKSGIKPILKWQWTLFKVVLFATEGVVDQIIMAHMSKTDPNEDLAQ